MNNRAYQTNPHDQKRLLVADLHAKAAATSEGGVVEMAQAMGSWRDLTSISRPDPPAPVQKDLGPPTCPECGLPVERPWQGGKWCRQAGAMDCVSRQLFQRDRR